MKSFLELIYSIIFLLLCLIVTPILAPVVWWYGRVQPHRDRRKEAFKFLDSIHGIIKHREELSSLLAMNTGFKISLCDQFTKEWLRANDRARVRKADEETRPSIHGRVDIEKYKKAIDKKMLDDFDKKKEI